MSDIKGRFVFIPDDGGEAYEIDLNAVLEDAAALIAEPWWRRALSFLQSFKSKKEKTQPLALPVVSESINLPDRVCAELEKMFSTAEWHNRDEFGSSVACYILDVTPRLHAEGYEAMVTLTLPGGSVQDIPLADLLTHYIPYAPEERDRRYEH